MGIDKTRLISLVFDTQRDLFLWARSVNKNTETLVSVGPFQGRQEIYPRAI